MRWTRSSSQRAIVSYQLYSRRTLSTNNPTEARVAAERLLATEFKTASSNFTPEIQRQFLIPFQTALPPVLRFGDPNSPKESLGQYTFGRYKYRPLSHFFPYFHRAQDHSSLAPDGADGLRWPGKPWDMRVWAGGRMQLLESPVRQNAYGLKHYRVEKVKSVHTVGEPPNDKIYATFRKIITFPRSSTDLEAATPALLQAKDESEMKGSAIMVEEQTLCYMRLPSDPSQSLFAKPRPIIPPPAKAPDYSWTMTPTSSLLFFFSASTLNAHAIHLDPNYARSHYGLKDIIVQGQLTVFLMLEVLRAALAEQALRENIPLQEAVDIEYRNLSPLYVNEPIQICCARVSLSSGTPVGATDTEMSSNTAVRPPQPPTQSSPPLGSSQEPNDNHHQQSTPTPPPPPSNTAPQEWSIWIQTAPPSNPDPTTSHVATNFEPTVAVRARVRTRQLDPLGLLATPDKTEEIRRKPQHKVRKYLVASPSNSRHARAPNKILPPRRDESSDRVVNPRQWNFSKSAF